MISTFFRHGATAALAVMVLALAAAMIAGFVAFHPLEIALGALLFYGSEYVMHRFAFHAPPARGAFIRRLQHRLHYDHHLEPARLDLLFLPLWFLVPNLAVAAGLVGLILGPAAVASTMLGVLAAIFHYEWTHYVAHTPLRPLTGPGRWVKQYHLRHHFISEKLWFGVSNPSLDLVFGTLRAPESAERSPTVRKLHEWAARAMFGKSGFFAVSSLVSGVRFGLAHSCCGAARRRLPRNRDLSATWPRETPFEAEIRHFRV